MKIYTRTGDLGDTGLFGGARVPKNHPRVAAYGDVDELNSLLGVARASAGLPRVDDVLVALQRDLFAIGALLATPDVARMQSHLEKARIDGARIIELERAIDECDAELEPLKAFIVPGGSAKSAALHHARTVCRRAERAVVGMGGEEKIPPIVVIYLNRLSDLLFSLARVSNKRAGVAEDKW